MTRKILISKALKWVFFLIIFFAIFGPVFHKIFAGRFMPAPNVWPLPVWLISFACSAAIAGFLAREVHRKKKPIDSLQESWANLGTVFAFFLGFVWFYDGFNVGLPFMLSLFGQSEFTLIYEVIDPEVRDSSKLRCFSAVELNVYASLLFDDVCGVPEELRATLSRGDTIELSGYGNRWGIFYAWPE